ncbi:MAG: hypothetical protein V1755_05520 [Chloroflexota bacterium]
MTREEHNEKWNVNRQPNDPVHCNLFGYGEISQYDPLCPACWLGHSGHTWGQHDAWVLAARRAKERTTE